MHVGGGATVAINFARFQRQAINFALCLPARSCLPFAAAGHAYSISSTVFLDSSVYKRWVRTGTLYDFVSVHACVYEHGQH